MKYGRIETGVKLRNRNIPTNMQFIPGVNSVLDTSAGGWATYKELIPAVYGNYIFEKKQGTIELLFTKPLSNWDIVNGKFLGAFILIVLAIVPTVIYVFTISYFGNPRAIS